MGNVPREIAVAEGPIREESAQAQESRLSSLMESLQRFQQEPNPGPDFESQQQCTVIEIRKLLKDSRCVKVQSLESVPYSSQCKEW